MIASFDSGGRMTNSQRHMTRQISFRVTEEEWQRLRIMTVKYRTTLRGLIVPLVLKPDGHEQKASWLRRMWSRIISRLKGGP